jgi:hypothetical protein
LNDTILSLSSGSGTDRVLEVVLMDGMGTVTSRKEKVYIRSLELRA